MREPKARARAYSFLLSFSTANDEGLTGHLEADVDRRSDRGLPRLASAKQSARCDTVARRTPIVLRFLSFPELKDLSDALATGTTTRRPGRGKTERWYDITFSSYFFAAGNTIYFTGTHE